MKKGVSDERWVVALVTAEFGGADNAEDLAQLLYNNPVPDWVRQELAASLSACGLGSPHSNWHDDHSMKIAADTIRRNIGRQPRESDAAFFDRVVRDVLPKDNRSAKERAQSLRNYLEGRSRQYRRLARARRFSGD